MDRVCSRCATDLYVKLVTKKGHQGTAVRLVRGAVHMTFDIKLSTVDSTRLTIGQSFCTVCAPDGMVGYFYAIMKHLQHDKPEPPRKSRPRPLKCSTCGRRFGKPASLKRHEQRHANDEWMNRQGFTQTPLDRAQDTLTRRQSATLVERLFDLGNMAAASGPALDSLGATLGLTRGPTETDDSFRTRQRYQLQTNPPVGSTIVGDIEALPHPPALPTDVIRPPRRGR